MLKWVFGADTSPFRSALNSMRDETKAFSGSVKGQLAGMFGGAALLAGASKIISHFARIKDLADRFGESSTSMQKVGFAASQSGMDIEGVAKAMTVATKNAVEAASAGGDLDEAFKRLGINAASFANLPLEDKLTALNAGYNASSSSAQGLADIMKVLGKAGAESIPTLTQSVEDLKAQLESAPVAGEGVVTAIAGIDDRIDEMKTAALAMGGAVVAGLSAIAGTISTVVLGALDIMMDNLIMIGKVAVNSATIIGKTLTGDFKGAADAALNFGTIVKSSMGNMVTDAKKTGEAIGGIWDETFNGSDSGAKKKGPDIEAIKEAAEAQKRIDEERKKLTEDIGKLEEEARIRALSLTEKILDAEKRRAELAADALFGEDETKALEARKAQLEVEKEIAGYREKQSADDKKTADDKKKREDDAAKEIKTLTEKSADLERSNKLAGMDDGHKREFLKNERSHALKASAASSGNGDTKGALEFGNKAKALTGEIDDITRGLNDDLKKKLADAQKAVPTIATSSLADIGGGGGARLMDNDQSRRMVDLLAQIAANTAGGQEGSRPPEPI